jgi:signal transduction histidine kinase
MKDRNAALTEWVFIALSWLRTLSLRRDIVFPFGVLAVQLTGTALTIGIGLVHPAHPVHLEVVDWALLVTGPVALVMRRRHPVAVLWVTFASTLTTSSSSFAYLSLIIAFFVAATAGNRYSAWLVMALRFVWAIWLGPFAYGITVPPLNDALLLAGWLLVLVIAAEATRIRNERMVATKTARQIDQRRREGEERLGIARDLHDVIGHNISLINIQASMGLDLMDTQPEQARAALSAIKTASKDALEELRAMLTTLRRNEDAAPRAPAPGLDRLPELVENSHAAGLSVEVQIHGMVLPLSPTVHLAAYRIIQESLTNVARHAGQARVTVRVTFDDAELRVEVSDDGNASNNEAFATGTGSGIAGMRERAAALGGVLHAGFSAGGGFRVSASLPIRSSS